MNFTDRFKNKTAIVTGGAQGIGRAIVERLAAEGAHVGILDRDTALAEAAAKELLARGNSVEALPCDITSDAGVREVFSAFATKHAQLTLYWGHPFVDLSEKKVSLQDYGLHFAVSINAF